MKEVDIMLTAIIVYLIIGAIIVVLCRDVLADVAKNANLAIKAIYYVCMIVVALPVVICAIAKCVYQALKNKLES